MFTLGARAPRWCRFQTLGTQSEEIKTLNKPNTCSLLRNRGLRATEPTHKVWTQGPSAQFSP